jgi:hypothetical protein
LLLLRFKTYFAALIVITSLYSCKKGHDLDCVKSNGPEAVDMRTPGKFKTVVAYNKIDVDIYQGAEYSIEVHAGAHIIKNISTKLINDSLIIQNTNVCNFVRGYKRSIRVKITMPYVASVYNYGVAPIVLHDFKQDSTVFVRNENSGDTYINGTFQDIITSSHGNGDMYVNGNARRLLIYMNGTNYTFAQNFQATDEIYISTYSIANAYFNLDGVKSFEYYIWSEGSIYYVGNPQAIHNLGDGVADGKGTLNKQD